MNRLQKTERLFRATFEQAAVGMAHVGMDGSFLRLNSKFAEICGYGRDEMLPLTFQDITHPEDLQTDLALLARLRSGEIPTYTLEKRYIRKDGAAVWVNLTVSMVRDAEDGDFCIAVIEDISLRKQTQSDLEALRRGLEQEVVRRTIELSEANMSLQMQIIDRERMKNDLDRLFDMSPGVLAMAGSGGRFFRVNPAFCRMLGYTEAEMTARPARDFVHPEDLESLDQVVQMVRDGHILQDFENRYVGRDGSVHWISWTAASVPEEGITFCVGMNVTASKEAERVIAAQKESMASASKMDALGRMAAGIAHEINNPLTVVYGQSCLLKDLAEDGDVKAADVAAAADKMEEMTKRIVDIISGLRAFAREGSRDPFESAPVGGIIENTLALCRGRLKSSNIRLEYAPPAEGAEVLCRPVQISQVLLNVLNNAHDAIASQGDDGRWIRLGISWTAEHLDIEVSNGGAPIDERARANLFQPFFTTKPVGKGTGLGLSIAKGIMGMHHGDIFLAPDEKQTRFVIRLPRPAAGV